MMDSQYGILLAVRSYLLAVFGSAQRLVELVQLAKPAAKYLLFFLGRFSLDLVSWTVPSPGQILAGTVTAKKAGGTKLPLSVAWIVGLDPLPYEVSPE